MFHRIGSVIAVVTAALLSTSCMNSIEGAIAECDDMTLEELQTQNTISDKCKTALRKILPSSDNNVNDAFVSLGSKLSGTKTLYLGGTTVNGIPLPLLNQSQLTVVAVTATGDSTLDTSRYSIQSMGSAGGSRLALTVSTDYSGSMSIQDIKTSSEIYHDLFTVLDTAGASGFEASIQRFSTTVSSVSGFLSRADSLKVRIAHDPDYSRESTALYDAIGSGISGLAARTADVKVLMVTTDGFENSSVTYKQAETLYDLAKQHKVRVIMIGTLVADLKFLRAMARQSGGLYIYNGKLSDVKAHVLKVGRMLSGAMAVELKNLPTGTDSVRFVHEDKSIAVDI